MNNSIRKLEKYVSSLDKKSKKNIYSRLQKMYSRLATGEEKTDDRVVREIKVLKSYYHKLIIICFINLAAIISLNPSYQFCPEFSIYSWGLCCLLYCYNTFQCIKTKKQINNLNKKQLANKLVR